MKIKTSHSKLNTVRTYVKLDLSEIRDSYLNGKTIREIAKEKGVSYFPIWEMLRKNNIPMRIGPKLKHLWPQIIKEYSKCKNATIIAKKYGVSIPTIINYLRRHGLNTARPRFKLNHDYFEKINTPDKAYFFGWLMSDGNITKNRIKLSIIDEEVLINFKKYLGFEGNILKYPNLHHKTTYTLMMNSFKMTEDLAKHGCIPNKTFKARSMKTIPDNLMQFFIRGYFEGDGCIRIRPHNNQAGFDIVGNKYILMQILNILKLKCNVNFYIRKFKKYIDISCSGNKQVKRIRDYIYKKDEVLDLYLNRKYSIFERVGLK